MELLLSWLVLSFAFWLTAVILPGFEVRGVGGAIVVAAIFGALNWLLGFLLFVVIGLGTLGLGFLLAFITRWIVMAILLKLTDAVTDRLTIRSFGVAFLAALLMSAFGALGEYVVRVAL
jgi:putative membrane protein